MPRHGRTAILADGDLPGLIALAAAAEAQVSLGDDEHAEIALLADARHLGPDAVACVRQQADRVGLAVQPEAPLLVTGDGAPSVPLDTEVLLRAASEAVRLGCRRLIWPTAVSAVIEDTQPDEQSALDQIAGAIDRALLIGRLASIDASAMGQPDLRIKTPYIDLSADQIADLALDLDTPVDACWWATGHAAVNPARADEARALWTTRLEALGATGGGDADALAQRQAELRAERLA